MISGLPELYLDHKSDGGLSYVDMLKFFALGGIATIFIPDWVQQIMIQNQNQAKTL